MRVELTTSVLFGDVDLSEVTNAGDLNVIGCSDEMNALESTVGDSTSTTARLGTPSNFLTLGIANSSYTGRSPDTEIIDVVDPSSLTLGSLTRASTAVVGTSLTVLRLVGRVISRVSDIPDLVVVPASALPNLNDIAIGGRTVGKVSAFAMIGPGKTFVGSIIPLLVLVS